MSKRIRTFTELQKYQSFDERYNYLKLNGEVGKSSFGFDRYLNQILYRSPKWLQTRDVVILRDGGCDLGIEGYNIVDHLYVHHMNPITIEEIELDDPKLFDPNFLISTSKETHLAIHYGRDYKRLHKPIERFSRDTVPWR